MFIDVAKIFVKGGKGGDGAVAFRREKYEPAGGPAGGDGGHGGSVILEVDEGIRTLMDFRYKKHYNAENGDNGRAKNQFGKKGNDLILKVPPGTIVKNEDGMVIADLVKREHEFVVANGGRGGKGNSKFTTSTRQAPRFAEAGTKGEEGWIVLELKLLADVGLIGFPNVGKSTFLASVTEARPKIANYHFTTLKPNLGVVKLGEGQSYVMADIPGLIEGAHTGTGLGHEFLRHIERTRLLVHIIDASAQEGRDPVADFHQINHELERYSEKLPDKPQIVVANKMDIPGANKGVEKLMAELTDKGYEVFSISAATGQGVNELKYVIWNQLKVIGDPEPILEQNEDNKLYKLREDGRNDVTIRKEDNKFIVEGNPVEKLMNSTNFDDLDSFRHFQKVIRKRGIIDELKAMGIEEGDIVNMSGFEFEFYD